MKTKILFSTGTLFLIHFVLITTDAFAHGIVGKRFFPATLAVHDPFPADEMGFAPSSMTGHDEKELSLGFGIQKRLAPNIALSIEGEYLSINPNEGDTENGFANPEITLMYALFSSSEQELIVSTSLGFEPGGIGSHHVGAEEESHIVPAFLFGKGFGNLSERFAYLKPLAMTGRVGLSVPTGKSDHHSEEAASTPEYGLVIEYSIPYLQSFVNDVGIPKPFNKMFPIIEFTYGGHHADKGASFLSPGILWAGKYVELGIEANIPLNDEAGDHVGVTGLIHLFLDDILKGRDRS